MKPLLKVAALAVAVAAITWLVGPLLLPVKVPEDFPQLPDLQGANPSLRGLLQEADREARRRPNSAEAVGKLGMAYHANLFPEQAAAAYRIAARLAPKDYRWAYCQAFLQEENGNEQEKVRLLQHTVQLKPDHVPALLRLADGEFKQDRLDEAALYYERAAGVHDSRYTLQAAFGLGRVAARRQKWGQVIAQVEPLTRSYPYLQPPYELLQEAYTGLGQTGKAAEAAQSITLSKSKIVPPPDDPLNDQLIALSYSSTRLLKQAGLLSRFGYPDQAIQVARRAAEADPKDADIRNFIARTLLTAYPNKPEAVDEGLTAIGECLRLRPGDPLPLWGFTNEFFETPKSAAAVERLSRLVAPFAGRGDAHFFLGMIADARGQDAEAVSQYEAARKDTPNNAGVYIKLGLICDREQKFDQAVGYFQKAIQLDPANTVAHFNLGVALLQHGKDGQGMKELGEVLRLKPHDAPTHFVMGFACLYSKRSDEAIAHFSDGLRYNPDDAEAHYGLGAALSMERRTDEAAAALRDAVRLRPNYPEAQALLQQLAR
ncbi:MAG TPA: tetratricopeptide repeat protein [Candidatus Sulfopaludibacter sp.]|nr:tetratricopeptide repeat protein [Candidatus Sulfopaludibacter sp.]